MLLRPHKGLQVPTCNGGIEGGVKKTIELEGAFNLAKLAQKFELFADFIDFFSFPSKTHVNNPQKTSHKRGFSIIPSLYLTSYILHHTSYILPPFFPSANSRRGLFLLWNHRNPKSHEKRKLIEILDGNPWNSWKMMFHLGWIEFSHPPKFAHS